MPARGNALDTAISSVHETLKSLLGDASKAASALKDAVASALARVTGNDAPARRGPGRPKGSGRKPVARKPSRKGGKKGPKPGGRQLKAHIGAKAFDALPEDQKDAARKAISKVGAEWKEMSKADRDELLSKHIKGPTKKAKEPDATNG